MQTNLLPIFTGVVTFCGLVSCIPVNAQIVPDNSLGSENSVVTPNVNIRGINSDRIDGGAVRGGNLFHSFEEFNVDEGRGAYFSNPDNIINILSRVTGNDISQILGTLGVLGNANLFLINPNGIVFGPNARLDVGGSFFASTADGILFENGVEFAASNPEAPPLLTINMPIGLNIRENPGTIVNQSVAVDSEDNFVGLQVAPRRTLGFVGGDIQIEGGILTAPQGRIELGSVEGNNFVSLTPIDKGYATSYEGVQNFRDIALSQGAFVDVQGEGGGDIQVQGQRVTLTEGSVIEASTQGSESGGISTIRASESVEVVDSSIFADVNSGATGQGGNIIINTQNLLVQDGGRISTSTFGNGNAGNMSVQANQIEVIGINTNGRSSGLRATVGSQAFGNSGTLNIDTQNLSVRDGAQVLTSTFGNGNGGNLAVTATDIEVVGTSADGQIRSGLFTTVESEAIGNAGNLTINTQHLLVQDGARILADTFAEGNAGNLTINTQRLLVQDGGQISASIFGSGEGGNLSIIANEIELVGTSDENQSLSGLFAQTNPESIGNAGNLTIDTQRLIVRDGARVSASTFGEGDAGQLSIRATDFVEVTGNSSFINADVRSEAIGNAGDLTINTQRLLVEDGGQISASIFGSGEGGNLSIIANEIELVGTSDENQSLSGLFAQINPESRGNAGNLTIDTQRLIVRDGARISASTFGEGNAGQLSIKATDFVEVTGDSSFINADVRSEAIGNAGDLTIDTQRLLVQDEARISTDTFGEGNAGQLFIRATDSVEVTGDSSFITADVNSEATGDGGDLTINTQRLLVQDEARISTDTFGEGNAGQLFIRATDSVEVTGNSSFITADVNSEATGDGGDLTINTQRLLVQDEARISTDTFGEGNAGQLSIRATDSVEVTGNSSFITADVNSEATGDGGDLTINTQRLLVEDGGRISTSSFGDGNAGNLTITATDIELVGRSTDGQFSSGLRATVGSQAMGNAGTLTINTQNLSVREGAQILASTFGDGNVGSLTITATDVELVGRSADGQFSSALAASVEQGATGNSGTLTIDTQRLSVREGAQILAATFGSGNAGNLTINATDVELVGRSADGQFSSALSASVEQGGTGNGGNLTINTQNLSVRDGAQVTAVTFADGDGGNLIVTATDIEVVGTSADGQFRSGLFASVEPDATGNSNSLIIDTQRLSVRDGAFVSTSTFGDGNAGNLTVTATDVELIGTSADGQFRSSLGAEATSESTGRAGTLTVNADNLTVRDGATVDVRSEGTEAAGDLIVNAPVILLDNEASLNAETTAGQGNIILNTSDLRLRNNSNITTNATGEATGGNIEINTDNLIAIEDSDISANAQAAFGGQVIINADAIFGTQFRTQQTGASDITATSELGASFSGTVELNSEIDPAQGLVDLPQTVVDPAALIAQDPCIQGRDSSFTITGRGGIAPDPTQPLSITQGLIEWESFITEPTPPQPNNSSQRRQQQSQKRDNNRDDYPVDSRTIVPARGWIRTEDGEVILVSYDPTKTGVQRQPPNPYSCQS